MTGSETIPLEEFLKNKWIIGTILALLVVLFAILFDAVTERPRPNENLIDHNITSPLESTTTSEGGGSTLEKPTISNKTAPIDAALEYCPGLSGSSAAECLTKMAIDEGKTQICEKIDNKEDSAYCISSYAAKVDPKACDLFKDYEDELVHYVKCASEVAVIRADPTQCDRLPQGGPSYPSSLCRLNYFFNDRNRKSSDCAKITEKSMNGYCYAVIIGDPKYCARLKDSQWGGSWLYEKCANCIKKGFEECMLYLSENGEIVPKNESSILSRLIGRTIPLKNTINGRLQTTDNKPVG
ncbi:MAG: hypothetical protein V1875_00560 [Candidatus Altiarchaeota archaeon]